MPSHGPGRHRPGPFFSGEPKGEHRPGHGSQADTPLRVCLTLLLRRFSSRRRSRDFAVGLDFRRGVTGKAALRIIPTRRSRASFRFRSCVLNRLASITSTPPPVIRFPSDRTRRSRTSSGSDRELRTLNRSLTAVATLLTFCPPGPEDRKKRSRSSFSSRTIVSVTLIILSWYRSFRFRGRRRIPCSLHTAPAIGIMCVTEPVRSARAAGRCPGGNRLPDEGGSPCAGRYSWWRPLPSWPWGREPVRGLKAPT